MSARQLLYDAALQRRDALLDTARKFEREGDMPKARLAAEEMWKVVEELGRMRMGFTPAQDFEEPGAAYDTREERDQ